VFGKKTRMRKYPFRSCWLWHEPYGSHLWMEPVALPMAGPLVKRKQNEQSEKNKKVWRRKDKHVTMKEENSKEGY
jgi:hypothetical protein